MDQAQVLNLALTVIPMMTIVLVGILVNNARLNDFKDTLRAEIGGVKSEIGAARGETAGLRAELRTETTSLRVEVYSLRDVLRAEMDKNHSEMLHRFADLDTRMTRIENGLGMNRS
jgi:hypothetical protein